jgi:hypothetical protein
MLWVDPAHGCLILNIVPNHEKIKLNQRFEPTTHNVLFGKR